LSFDKSLVKNQTSVILSERSFPIADDTGSTAILDPGAFVNTDPTRDCWDSRFFGQAGAYRIRGLKTQTWATATSLPKGKVITIGAAG